MTILIIEDSAFTRRRLARILSAAGHDVEEAHNGKEGLNRIHTQAPDCIILDLLMPEVDGLTVLETLRQEESAIPVLVLSADVQESTQATCLALGAAAFLEKPPHEQTLLEVVRGLACVK